jgi:hypothetical protein
LWLLGNIYYLQPTTYECSWIATPHSVFWSTLRIPTMSWFWSWSYRIKSMITNKSYLEIGLSSLTSPILYEGIYKLLLLLGL